MTAGKAPDASGGRPLRVLAISDFYLPRSGGVERVVHETARRLPESGVVVEVLTRRLVADDAGRAEIDGVTVHRIGSGPAPLALELGRLSGAAGRWAGAELGRFDLVHAHLTLTAWPLLGRIASRGLPLVATFYGPWHREYLEELADPAVPSRWPAWLRPRVRPLVARVLFRLQRQVLGAARRVIVLSEHSRRELGELGFAVSAPIERVPGGVDVERFRPAARSAAAARLPGLRGCGRPLLVAVRRLVPRMGLAALLDAVHRLRPSYPGLTLALAGVGPLAGFLEQEAKRLGLGPGFRLLGRVEERDLPDLYAAADLTVVPTRALEGFGLPVLESWACAVPVVATRVGALEELVAKMGPEWMCEPGDPASLAEAIAGGLRAPAGTAERARDLALSHRWETVSEQLAAVYARAREGSRAS